MEYTKTAGSGKDATSEGAAVSGNASVDRVAAGSATCEAKGVVGSLGWRLAE